MLSAVDTSHNNQIILTPPLASLSFKSHLPSEHNLPRAWKRLPLRQRQAVSQAPALQVINTSDEAVSGRGLHFGLTLATMQYTLDEP